jgi:hypothetical protein
MNQWEYEQRVSNSQYNQQLEGAIHKDAVNSGLYNDWGKEEPQSGKEFFMQYEDLLYNRIQEWRGYIWNPEKNDWVKHDGVKPIMDEEAISIISGFLRNFLSNPNRLSSQDEKHINIFAYQGRKHISRFLHVDGWRKHSIEIENLRRISFEVGQLIYAGLTWSRNGGGQRFINQGIRSVEINNLTPQRDVKGRDVVPAPNKKLW